MTTVMLNGFLSKKEIESAYGRSFRSLTRDITRAVKAGDIDVLRHLKLVTEDNVVREGTDITLDMIQELSNLGQRPMWVAEESWVADWIARRSTRRREAAATATSQSRSSSDARSKASDYVPPSMTANLASSEYLLQRIEDQTQQINILRGQLQIKDEQIRTANQLAEQSQQLMRDLHVLLKNVQDGLLGEGSRRLITARTPATKSSQPAPQPVEQPAENTTRNRTSRGPSKSPSKKRNAKRTITTKPDAVPPPAGRLQRWFPTLLGSKRRGD